MNSYDIKSLFIAINSAIFILVLTGFGINKDYSRSKVNKLCFKYAAKKCNFRDKSKARLICNTLINHNACITDIIKNKESRKRL